MNFFAAISSYIQFFPLAAFVCLMLAGLNLPISEDLIIIAGSQVCRTNHKLLVPSLIAIYAGIVLSDVVSFFIGRQIGRGAQKFKRFRKALPISRVEKVRYYLEKYGIGTFIVCRFIPFGVRNALFLSSGFLNMKLKRFVLYDFPAAIISMNTLFWLTFFLGRAIMGTVKNVRIVMVIILALVVIGLVIHFARKSHKTGDKK
jgi:membrane protein DedA with SNARE-associated domain